jgi:hypothetical protein
MWDDAIGLGVDFFENERREFEIAFVSGKYLSSFDT